MGLLRDVVTAFKPENVKRGLAAARTPATQAELDAAVAALPPEQRAAYEANQARVEQARAESEASWQAATALSDEVRVLDGPAGRALYGAGPRELGSPAEIEAQIAEQGVLGAVAAMRAKRKGEFRQALRQTFGIPEVAEVEDPEERRRIAAEERAARDAARAPYRAPAPAAVAISRLATRGETQVAEVLAFLRASGLAARPDRVFGVYRVPDRISGPRSPGSERGRVVEWDVVHEPVDPPAGAAAPSLVATSFLGDEQWVARRRGEPSVLDEDLALAFCAQAGIGPERCLGLARVAEFRSLRGEGSEDTAGPLRTLVRGMVAIHAEESSGAFARLRDAAPLVLPAGPPPGVHVEVLNWEAVAHAVHPKIHRPAPVPSPFAYLPATPQELLRAHLEVVGLRAADCYAAQATVDRPRPLVQGGVFTTNLGPKQPCADGKPRMRTHGCEQVVVAYRDRPEYAAGRERWRAYQEQVLQARLERGTGVRAPVAMPDDLADVVPTRVLRAAARAAAAIDAVSVWLDSQETVPPYRYCWPPSDMGA